MDNTCPICIDNISDNSYTITVCKHTFHTKCLQDYDAYCIKNQKNLICPLCNTELQHLTPTDAVTIHVVEVDVARSDNVIEQHKKRQFLITTAFALSLSSLFTLLFLLLMQCEFDDGRSCT